MQINEFLQLVYKCYQILSSFFYSHIREAFFFKSSLTVLWYDLIRWERQIVTFKHTLGCLYNVWWTKLYWNKIFNFIVKPLFTTFWYQFMKMKASKKNILYQILKILYNLVFDFMWLLTSLSVFSAISISSNNPIFCIESRYQNWYQFHEIWYPVA